MAMLIGAFLLAGCGDDEPRPTPRPVPTVDPNQQRDRFDRPHEDLGDETPPGVPPEALERGEEQTREAKPGPPEPVGGAQNYSCPYRPVRNRSSRGGAKVRLAVLHYTVSPNRPGTGDMAAIRGLFDRRSFSASSTYLMDFEGHCWQLVPESQKPWTQGNLNPWSISIEIIATGRESRAQWLAAPIFRRGILASLWRDVHRRHGLPLRRGSAPGCGVTRTGWADHDQLGCGNNHTDVRPSFPYAVFQRQLTGPAALSCAEKVQAALNRKLRPSPRLDVDGIRGPKTAAAVRRFQRQAKVRGKNATRRALAVKC